MSKYLTLGEKAQSFHDPITGVNLSSKGEVVEISVKEAKSKRIITALKGGHLVAASKDMFDHYQTTTGKKPAKPAKPTEEEDDVVVTNISEMNVKQLQAYILQNQGEIYDTPYTKDDLKSVSKDDLKAIAVEIEEANKESQE